MWDQLPELILIKIFHHLSCADRFSIACTCTNWKHAVATPELWRSVTILIDRDLTSGFPLATQLAVKYGEHMRSLELAWTRPHVSSKDTRNITNVRAKEGIDFFDQIQRRKIQLREIIFSNWFLGTNWNYRGKILWAITHFLTQQKNLEILNLLNSNLGIGDILKLLRAVTTSSGNRLRSLDLRGAFRDWQTPHTNSKFLRYLSRFTALTILHLDYPSLSNESLDSLSTGAPNSLTNLHISLRDTDSHQHRIENVAWQRLTQACPQLTVSYTIVNISHFEDMSYLLQPSVPLASFRLYTGHVWDQNRSRNFRNTLGLLVTYYSSTLAEVILELRNNREQLDDLLVSMLQHCKLLTNLRYDGIIRSLETLSEILELQTLDKTQFQSIHFRPRRVNMQNREILSNICWKFNRQFIQRGIDFKIQHPGSTIFYC